MPLRYNPAAPVPGAPSLASYPTLADGQYAIDGFVFGKNTLLTVEQTAIGPVALTLQDQSVGAGDGQRFGTDYATSGKVLTFTGNILVSDNISALDQYDALEAYWNNPSIRLNPGRYSTLRCKYPNSTVVRRVFGRGRQIAHTLGMVSRGNVPFVAAFQMADGNFYSDYLQSATAGTGGVSGGAKLPNFVPNPDFASGVTGYTSSGGTLVQDTTQGFNPATTSGKFTPSGTNANPQFSTPYIAVTPGYPYIASVETLVGTTFAVGAYMRVNVYDASLTLLQTIEQLPIPTTTHGVWEPTGALFRILNTNARWATVQIWYNGTPAATEVINVGHIVFAFSPAGTLVFPATGPINAGSSPTISFNVPLTNSGKIPTWPKFVINGPVTNPFVNLIEPDIGFGITGTLPQGKSITVDMAPWSRSIIDNTGASWAGDYSGNAMTEFLLPTGVTTMQYGGQDSTGTTTCNAQWRTAFATIGGTLS